jgi:oligoendopeptidase F
MAAIADLAPPQVRWDLTALFSGIDDSRIDQTWSRCNDRADAFEKAYRGKINSPDLTAETLGRALAEIENIAKESAKPASYAQLLFACDASSPEIGAFMQKQMEKSSDLSVKVMFFELELQGIPQDVIDRIIGEPALANYTHYIQHARAYSPYRLSEKEEVVLEQTANTGSRAWVRLFEELLANHVFRLTRPGSDKVEELTEQQVLTLLREPDRALRQAAADSLSQGLQELQRVLVFTFNNLVQDKAVEDKIRAFEYPEQSRHLSNELDKETVDLVISMCRANYGLVERFYSIKREVLGLPELTHIDRYAPLFETEEQVDWDTARKIVLDAFGTFSSEMQSRAREFFDKNWIDAEPRKGKQGGAFCSYNTPDTHPVVFQTYLNKQDDVMTLAHELGHGVHASLSRAQSYFNFHGTLPLAELASTFGEMLVFESLVADASLKDKLAMYADKIEGVFATVFRQAAMFQFERRMHLQRRSAGELTPEAFGEIWQEEMQAMFGSSVKLGDQHRSWWCYVGHFIFAPFYVYAYSFGELLVLSLYQMAKQEGPSFADKYISLLEAGGSKSPTDLMQSVGVDLHSEEFWKGGFAAMEKLVTEFEMLWTEYRANR